MKSLKPICINLLLNKNGQMAVFIVLIFQVLFVLFAMVINIGLIVHDKINLQNSVDLAAYYAAQRQAESLNTIAHQNYQIRQAWKLLSWRYLVLGTSPMTNNTKPPTFPGKSPNKLIHPAARELGPTNNCFKGFVNYSANPGPAGKCKLVPVICMADIHPWEIKTKGNSGNTKNQDQFCRSLNFKVNALDLPRSIAGSAVSVAGVRSSIAQFNAQFAESCKGADSLQIVYASSLLTAFDHEQSNRLKILYTVAKDLSKSFDIDGRSIKEGAFKVLTKNLSYANAQSINFSNFKLYNSVSSNNKVKLSKWLVPIVVNPAIIFARLKAPPGQGCFSGEPTILAPKLFLPKNNNVGLAAFQLHFPGQSSAMVAQVQRSIYKSTGRKLENITKFLNNPAVNDPEFLTVGVEKNPWYRVYAGVSATTKPRELFWLGKPVTLKAVAFATPFGGRVGPWYGKTWRHSEPWSVTDLSKRVDLLLPPRDTFRGKQSETKSTVQEFVPNFSLFPGDKMGLLSSKALAAVSVKKGVSFNLSHLLQSAFNGNIKNGSFALKDETTLSKLPKEGGDNQSPRSREIAVLNPNYFDITYYSVFPDAKNSFMQRVVKAQASKKAVVIREDMGNYLPSKNTSLKKRIEALTTNNKVDTEYGKFITNPELLLTGWIPNGPYTYTFNKNAFQKCTKWGKAEKAPVMGACASGGRVGYSVKIISKDALNSNKLSLGGHSGAGSLKNPPLNF